MVSNCVSQEGSFDTICSRQRRVHAEKGFSSKDPCHEKEEDSPMMWFIALAFIVMMAYIRYIDRF